MSALNDLTGQKFSRLTVIKRVENIGKATRWLCKCDCGVEKIFYGSNLKRGLSTSCGCFRKEKLSELKLQNLVGMKFNRLTVIELDHYNPKNRQYYWKCSCECGGNVVVYGGHLKSGHTKSCGCFASIGEEKIANILEKNGFIFIKNKILDLVLPTGGKAKFDFVIYEKNKINFIIEYDGEQHTKKDNTKWNRNGKFEIRQESDKIKTKYCLEKKIPLIRIPYTQYDELSILDLIPETSLFLMKEEQNEQGI